LKCGLCGDWPAARRDRERVGRRAPRFAMKQGRRPTPATGATGLHNLPKRERTGKSPRRPVASVAALSVCWLFSPGPGPEAACRCHPTSRRRLERCQRQRSLAAFGPAFVSAARLPSTQRRRPQARQHTRNGLPGSSPPLPRITTDTTGLAGTTVLNHFTSWDYLSPPARLGADLIRVQRVRAGF
jgi:hypothetical protein